MPGYLEAILPGGIELVPLEGERLTIGKGDGNDLPLPHDSKVSRLHAVLEKYPSGWCVQDLGSTNGTTVNGERVWGTRVLRTGDEIVVGMTRLRFRDDPAQPRASRTEVAEKAPDLTRRERDILLALCKPVMGGDLFTEPASIKQIAADLYVSEAAVKQHLSRLYDKFAMGDEGGERRRVRLANEAIRRAAVTLADLRALSEGDDRA